MGRWFGAATLLALAAGLGLGAWIQASGVQADAAVDAVGALGGLWLNALRMTVVPLVVALLITGVASVADAAATGRLAARTVALFAVLLIAATGYALAAMTGWLSVWPVDPAGARALIAGAAGETPPEAAPLELAAWLQGLAPANPIKAAAEDAILPLVTFGIFFGFAATRLEPAKKAALVGFFEAAAEALIVIVRWVLLAAPLGVFALALGVGARTGLSAVGTIGQYLLMTCVLITGAIVAAYGLALAGGVGPWRFAKAAGPVQVFAVSTQSSLASLPLMVERAGTVLRAPTAVSGLVLPLSVAVFRITSPVANLAVVLFCAAVFGVELDPARLFAGAAVALAVSIGTVGLPGQVSFFASISPICLAMGVPLELLPLLLAVEVVPDIFRTVGNVTTDLAATAFLSKGRAVDEA